MNGCPSLSTRKMRHSQTDLGTLLPTLQSKSTSVTFESDDSLNLKLKTESKSGRTAIVHEKSQSLTSKDQLENLQLEELILMEIKLRKNNQGVLKPSNFRAQPLKSHNSPTTIGQPPTNAQLSFLKKPSTDKKTLAKGGFFQNRK